MSFRNGVVLQLGAIATTVNIDSAVQAETSLKTVCRGVGTSHPPAPIKNNPTCPSCGNTDYGSFEKARLVGKSEYAVIGADEVLATRETAVGATKEIISLSIHKADEARSQVIQGDNSTYYLSPGKPALMPLYSLIVDLLHRHPEYALMGLWTPTSRAGLYEVRAFGDTLVMEPRARTETLKIAQQPIVPIDANQQAMADTIAASLVTPFDPATYADTYQANLEALIASKTTEEGLSVTRSKSSTAAVPTGAVDLTALLQGALGAAA